MKKITVTVKSDFWVPDPCHISYDSEVSGLVLTVRDNQFIPVIDFMRKTDKGIFVGDGETFFEKLGCEMIDESVTYAIDTTAVNVSE
jgi:hypothetical protein